MFTIRFDMRAPSFGAPTSDLYAAAIDMCAWAETRGAIVAVLSEHHGAEDNHLPSPLVLASAIAARTERLAIMLAAVVLPFWDPVRLAEDISVLDIISKGRVSYAFGIGHRPEEYEHFGIDMRRRGRLADEKLTLLQAAADGRAGGLRRKAHPRHARVHVPGWAVHDVGRRQPSRGQARGDSTGLVSFCRPIKAA